MNFANQLTLLRLVLTIVFVAALSSGMPFGRSIALLLFVIAGITDYIDGAIARRWNLITDFGKLMDPLVDKVMVASAFILLIPHKALPAWVVILIVTREFLVTGLRLIALSKGRVMAAERLGKHKTAWQIATVIVIMALLAAQDWLPRAEQLPWWKLSWEVIRPCLIAIATLFTAWSGFGYAWKNRHILSD